MNLWLWLPALFVLGMATMATLGYSTGPITFFGRMVAAVLMILGIACFGLITATATTFFLQRTE